MPKFPSTLNTLSKFVPVFRGYNSFRIRFQPVIRYRKPYYRIIVTNLRNSFLACLGFYNPHRICFNQSYKKEEFESLQGKILVLDARQTMYWLKVGAIPQPFLVLWLYRIGLLKSSLPVVNRSIRQIKRVINLLYCTDKIRDVLRSDSVQRYSGSVTLKIKLKKLNRRKLKKNSLKKQAKLLKVNRNKKKPKSSYRIGRFGFRS